MATCLFWKRTSAALAAWAAACAFAQTPAIDLTPQLARLLPTQTVPWRIEIKLGSLDERLKLAPCQKVEPYMPNGRPLWGKTRVGLRCLVGEKKWNVYLPVEVSAWAPALTLVRDKPVGSVIEAGDVMTQEVDWAAENATPFTETPAVMGRVLARSMSSGQALRPLHLRPRQLFAAGDTVRVISGGEGFSITATAEAMGPGLEGQWVKARSASGRLIAGKPVGERLLEVPP